MNDSHDAVNFSLPSHQAIFVGREAEKALLSAALEDACTDQGGLVLLAGEPGTGKTRTAEELGLQAAQRGVQVLWGALL
jgi:predicted ATPase